mmetsp:Transcript_8440/g.38412  ORF Transcript_8440/g.38412 Transcript_8440/m.38412 type:complete len:206 (+) Transcript_8440:1155-1772(+)
MFLRRRRGCLRHRGCIHDIPELARRRGANDAATHRRALRRGAQRREPRPRPRRRPRRKRLDDTLRRRVRIRGRRRRVTRRRVLVLVASSPAHPVQPFLRAHGRRVHAVRPRIAPPRLTGRGCSVRIVSAQRRVVGFGCYGEGPVAADDDFLAIRASLPLAVPVHAAEVTRVGAVVRVVAVPRVVLVNLERRVGDDVVEDRVGDGF